ncbi:hypothetical protein AVEN_224505-1 [Araneus ventricosus]|uniref:DUF4817 domain-containing protein n=1 Tax=Araneus ventricosus TaxID=182803 RepID=A0A4Y2TWU3_ARAVE|nr:hypothetical protein AVEN_224505-1 [Araneus ventricosus]
MTRTTPELAPPSPNFRATPTGGRLTTTALEARRRQSSKMSYEKRKEKYVVGSLEPAIPKRPDPPRTRRKPDEKGNRGVVKTTLHYITRRGLKGPCRVTVGRSPKLTVKKNSLRCGSFQ